jgi:hypothetical protein
VGIDYMVSSLLPPFPNKKAQQQGIKPPPLGFQLVAKNGYRKW